MRIAKVYISILFAVIFVFPSVYQGVHVVHTHWQKAEVHHCTCHHDALPNGEVNITTPTEAEDGCAVCEYEIAVFNHTHFSSLEGVLFTYSEAKYPIEQCFVQDQYTTVNKLRGPPSVSFV